MAKRDNNRNDKGRFVDGNNAAEKWTEKTTLELLTKMWSTLTEGHEDVNGNFVRANDMKTIQEVCLMHDIDPDTWTYIQTKFKENHSVFRLIKKIKWVLEARLLYSGQTMDIFVLKNHYDYKDKTEQDVNVKKVGKDLEEEIYE